MKIAASLRLDVALNPLQRLLIEELRGNQTAEQFLTRMVELGLAEMLFNLARYHREGMIGELADATIGDHENGRALLFGVKNAAPQPPTPEPIPELQTNSADPNPNHLPGLRRR